MPLAAPIDVYDYIIVGGGSAGCVLANRLSACGNFRVALFEAGGPEVSSLSKAPGGVARFMHSRKFNWRYRSVDSKPLRNGKGLYTPRGKGLGGSSMINAMIYTRGAPADYAHWQQVAGPTWGWDNMLQRFKQLECNSRGFDEFHGADGPLKVSDVAPYYQPAQQFIKAAAQAGYPLNSDFNGASLYGVGPYQFTIHQGERFSARDAFLEPARHRDNLVIHTNCLVERVIFDDDRTANGILYSKDHQVKTVMARKEVIISGGAINSPQLLLLSGIGPAEHLQSLGIPVVVDAPEVGDNLQEHVDVMVHYRNRRKDGIALNPRGLMSLLKGWFQYQKNKTGPLAHGPAEVGGFIRSHPDIETPDLQLHFVSTRFHDSGYDMTPAFRHGFACHVCVLRPKARGQLRLQSKDPVLPPHFRYEFLQHKSDQQALLSGVKQIRKIMAQPEMAAHNGGEVWPGPTKNDDELLAKLLQQVGLIYHPTSTCRMGLDSNSVVDERLNVRGVRGLRVVDASVMPTVLSGNTNAPTMAIADIGADFILADAN